MKTSIHNKTSFQREWAQWVIWIVILIMLLIVSLANRGFAQTVNVEDIDKIAEKYVTNHNNRGLVIGILKNNSQRVLTYGETTVGSRKKPSPDAIFEIGGISEVFTTTLMARMEAEGQLSTLEAAEDVLKGVVDVPSFRRMVCVPTQNQSAQGTPIEELNKRQLQICYPDPADAPQVITLCDLASNTSGLPAEPSNWKSFWGKTNPYAAFDSKKLNHFVSETQLSKPFGYIYERSMVGMALLGEALAIRGNDTYENLVREAILKPFGMNQTAIRLGEKQQKMWLKGHTNKGKATEHWDFNALAPAAGWRSNAPDLLAFLAAHLTAENTPLSISVNETQLPRTTLGGESGIDNTDAGWGWLISQSSVTPKQNVHWLSGKTGGFAAFVAFNKSAKIAVVVLSNSANSVDALGFDIMKLLESKTGQNPTLGSK